MGWCEGEKKITQVKWEDMCKNNEGGSGVKSVENFNVALLCK